MPPRWRCCARSASARKASSARASGATAAGSTIPISPCWRANGADSMAERSALRPRRLLEAAFVAAVGAAILWCGWGFWYDRQMPGRLERVHLGMDRKSAEAILGRSEEHTSELQSQSNLVCRLLLEKKKNRQHC